MITEYQRYRLYEILPGLSIWGSLVLALVLSIVHPVAMIYFILLFDVYWVLKVLNYVLYLTIAWRRFTRAKAIDWTKKMRVSAPGYETKKHVVFLTLYNEEWGVIKTAMDSLVASVYDPQVFTIVVAGEARKEEHCRMIYAQICDTFRGAFADIVLTMHPANLSDEIPGKGSNLHYSETQMKHYIDEKGWSYDDVIVTLFDIDTVCHVSYFSYLTYLYCTHPRPTRSSYQPIALYNNNMWESPAVLRIMAFGTTFWTMMSLARQDGLVTFSSHSMSFRALVDAGFHEKRIVSEDSRIFYQCFLAYNGDYEVTPMYSPVSMDTVRDDSWWQSIKNLYLQQRRWAWGVEHVPFLLWEFRKKGSAIPLWKKMKYLFLEWEGKWSWCIVAILITVVGRLPLWVSGEEVRQSALWFNAPHVLGFLMSLSMMGMFLSAILSLPLLPPRPASHPLHKYIFMLLQWLLLPISILFVSAIPGIDAATHLMRGKYLGFNVSQKKRAISS